MGWVGCAETGPIWRKYLDYQRPEVSAFTRSWQMSCIEILRICYSEVNVLRSARYCETAWIISGPRLVQIQDDLSEAVVNYRELKAVQHLC